jgi:hypothetical protein
LGGQPAICLAWLLSSLERGTWSWSSSSAYYCCYFSLALSSGLPLLARLFVRRKNGNEYQKRPPARQSASKSMADSAKIISSAVEAKHANQFQIQKVDKNICVDYLLPSKGQNMS